MTPTELTQEGFDRVVGDAIDVVTRVYVEARQSVLYLGDELKKKSRSSALGVVQVYGDSLGKMLWSDLRSWVGIVAGDGLADRQADDTPAGVDADNRPRRGFHELEPGVQLLFAKIVLRVPRARSEPHVMIGLLDQFRVEGEDAPSALPLRIPVGRFNELVEALDDGHWREGPVLLKTRTPVVKPKRGWLTMRLASKPVKFPLFDLQGPDALDRVIDAMLRLPEESATGR